ncbi:hypothetical protein [Sphingopyxis witflariensis]|uniref:DUF2059 domain-containing protein n=1 Tax=Sphingopyxis witflariensis TaxID=173675 RepID=A0A246JII3_9SPHN|nr:hypothetical protein [Sphingopyxis witflariensis]OWQ92456.1 hypothetical protein CDQ91_18440 [Sphingopyxis witflariensis]
MLRWTTLAALPLLALVAPLPAHAADTPMQSTVERLNDPAQQDRMADTVAAMVRALMQLNVGPLAEAVARVDPESDAAYIPPDATLGEIAGKDDPYYAERVGDDVRAGSRMAGQAASTLASYAPVLKDMARDLAAQWEKQRDAERR